MRTCNWYSSTGNSVPLLGPNCFLTAEYRTAVMMAFCKLLMQKFTMATLPAIKLPKEAPEAKIKV
jgi:hypothetical protein